MTNILKSRINERLKSTGLKAAYVSKKAGYSADYIRNIYRGGSQSPRTGPLLNIADILECSVEYLLGHIDTLFPDGSMKLPTVPLVSNVQAGLLAEAYNPYPVGIGGQEIPYEKPHQKIALKVEGNSMNRVSPEGSIIIVDLKDREMKPGYLYVVKFENETTYKKFHKNPDRLVPVSTEEYDTIYLGDKPIFPVGRVVRTMMDFK